MGKIFNREEEIIQDYNKLKSSNQVAKKYNVSKNTILRILKKKCYNK
jgi:Mor family transcriptional regulator